MLNEHFPFLILKGFSKPNITVSSMGAKVAVILRQSVIERTVIWWAEKNGAYKGLHQIHQRCNLSFVEESIEYFR